MRPPTKTRLGGLLEGAFGQHLGHGGTLHLHFHAGGKLDMQIKVEKGHGYVPGTLRRYADEPTKSIGRIVLDASFSPVKRVSYAVENARVEQRTDLDKLVMEIETNGAINAEDAVRASAKILVEQLAVFAQLEGSV